jgi:hypothetical protein
MKTSEKRYFHKGFFMDTRVLILYVIANNLDAFCQSNSIKSVATIKNQLVGEWMRTDENRNTRIISFKKDGSGNMEQWEFVYQVLNDKQIKFNDYDGNEFISEFVIDKNSLILSGGYFSVKEIFFVKGSNESYRPYFFSNPEELIGYWKAKDGGKIQFTKEGKMRMGGGVYGYKATENTITFTGSNGQKTVEYKLRGAELTIDFPDKRKTFLRSSADDVNDPFEKNNILNSNKNINNPNLRK